MGKRLLRSVQAGCGAHPASSSMGNVTGTSPEDKVADLEAGYSPPASSDAKNEWSYTFIPHMTSRPAQG